MAAADPDLALRQAAVSHARDLAQTYDDLVPLERLREGFAFDGALSFGSFYKGIHRPGLQRGPAALTLTTSVKDPYDDAFDEVGALSPTPIAMDRSIRRTTARCVRRTNSRRHSSNSRRSRRASISSSRRCS